MKRELKIILCIVIVIVIIIIIIIMTLEQSKDVKVIFKENYSMRIKFVVQSARNNNYVNQRLKPYENK